MSRAWGIAILAVLITACHTTAVKAPPAPIAQSPDQLVRAIADDAKRSDQASDAKVREALAADALGKAQACVADAPQDAGCLYYDGVALGLDARAHPGRALETLKTMLKALERAEAKDPNYDQAGPSRVRALVLIRAPGWPLGPGDPDAGLSAAKHAVELKPNYPPNQLALAEAQAKIGDAQGAQQSYRLARDLAAALPANAERDDWLKQADQGLKRP
jgi:hypothetical protein